MVNLSYICDLRGHLYRISAASLSAAPKPSIAATAATAKNWNIIASAHETEIQKQHSTFTQVATFACVGLGTRSKSCRRAGPFEIGNTWLSSAGKT
eukprot:5276101-Amphidinium_carterae.1